MLRLFKNNKSQIDNNFDSSQLSKYGLFFITQDYIFPFLYYSLPDDRKTIQFRMDEFIITEKQKLVLHEKLKLSEQQRLLFYSDCYPIVDLLYRDFGFIMKDRQYSQEISIYTIILAQRGPWQVRKNKNIRHIDLENRYIELLYGEEAKTFTIERKQITSPFTTGIAIRVAVEEIVDGFGGPQWGRCEDRKVSVVNFERKQTVKHIFLDATYLIRWAKQESVLIEPQEYPYYRLKNCV